MFIGGGKKDTKMRKLIFKAMLFAVFLGSAGFNTTEDPSKWSDKKVGNWFKKAEWLNGWSVKPDVSIDKKEFAIAYFRNRERWDKAFLFLKNNDLMKLELKRFDIDGDNLFVTISEYTTKNFDDAKYEGHKKYIDIQYVVSGTEIIGIAPASQISLVTDEYNAGNDIAFYTVGKGKDMKATPGTFFIFLPNDIHRPGVAAGENSIVRKIVIKVKID